MTGFVSDLAIYDTKLVAVGHFYPNGPNSVEAATFDGTSWTTLVTASDWSVDSVAIYLNQLYVAGGFEALDGIPVSGVARWDGTTWKPTGPGASAVEIDDLEVTQEGSMPSACSTAHQPRVA